MTEVNTILEWYGNSTFEILMYHLAKVFLRGLSQGCPFSTRYKMQDILLSFRAYNYTHIRQTIQSIKCPFTEYNKTGTRKLELIIYNTFRLFFSEITISIQWHPWYVTFPPSLNCRTKDSPRPTTSFQDVPRTSCDKLMGILNLSCTSLDLGMNGPQYEYKQFCLCFVYLPKRCRLMLETEEVRFGRFVSGHSNFKPFRGSCSGCETIVQHSKLTTT